MRITLRCTPTQSVLLGYRCVHHIRLNNVIYLKAILSWVWALIQQIRVSCTGKQTGIAREPKLTSRKGEKRQRRRDPSASGKEQPRQRGSIEKLDYTS